jgi:CyaY protein
MTSFSQTYDATIRDLEQKLAAMIDSGSEFDFTRTGDVLTIEFDDGERIVITPQSPMEQLWISANYAGHRFNWNGSEWVNEKGGESLAKFLSQSLSAKLGNIVEFE